MELPKDGALLINKHAGISSFGIIEELQKILVQKTGVKRRDLPKLGHGGTLDPFATGLLVVCVGRGVKLAQYFLGSAKTYEGLIRFGETTVPGDPTTEISERVDHLPGSIEEIRKAAHAFTLQPYLQTPPMHSAKKQGGKPLYLLAREGLEVERKAKTCHLYSFEILSYENARSAFRLRCSSGTYVRTLSQDLGRLLGSLGMLDTLDRTASGNFTLERACTTAQIAESDAPWDELPCWVPFDRMLESFDRAEATEEEMISLFQGRQNVLFNILKRAQRSLGSADAPSDEILPIYHKNSIIAIARQTNGAWGLDRVFVR